MKSQEQRQAYSVNKGSFLSVSLISSSAEVFGAIGRIVDLAL